MSQFGWCQTRDHDDCRQTYTSAATGEQRYCTCECHKFPPVGSATELADRGSTTVEEKG